MSFAERKDFGVRLGFEKGRKPDEGIVRSQIQPGRNVTFEYMQNWDIKIHATAMGNVAGVRNMIAYVKTQLRPIAGSDEIHIDLQDTGNGIAAERKFFGTAVYQDVYHNWDLPGKDHFIYVVEDLRTGIAPSIEAMQSIPHVVGVDNNRVRIWATDPKTNTRHNPHLWVDSNGTAMGNTRLVDRRAVSGYERPHQAHVEKTPYYAIKIYEITDLPVSANQNKTNDRVQ